jgi:hypothetical protein
MERRRHAAAVFVIDGGLAGGRRAPDRLAARVAQHGRPRRRGPQRGIDRLPVVVRVEGDRPRGARHGEVADDERRRARLADELRLHPTPLQHRRDGRRILLDVRRI